QVVFAHFTNDCVQNLFIGFTGSIYIADFKVVAGQFDQGEMLAFAVNMKLLIHAIHHVGNPTGAGFKKADFQAGKKIKDPVEHDACQLNHLSDRMLKRVNHRHGLQEVEAEAAAHGTVNGQRDIESLRFFVDRMKILVAVAFVQHG